MTGRYGRTELYTSRLPVRRQIGGSCESCTRLYAMEMLGLLTNQPVVQLSQLYQFTRWGNSVCAEHLWPGPLTYGPTTWLDGVGSSERSTSIFRTAPDAICVADAENHKLLDVDDGIPNTQQDIVAAIDAGYCLGVFVPPDHMEVVWDYDDRGVYGLDSRSANASPGAQKDWNRAVGYMRHIFKRAYFSGVVTPHRINPYMPNNNVSLVQAMGGRLGPINTITATEISRLWALVDALPFSQDSAYLSSMVNSLVVDATPIIIPPPPPTGNVMLKDQAIAAWTALDPIHVTQAQKDALANFAAQLTVDIVAPPAPATGWQVPPATSGVDAQGHVWSLGAASQYGKLLLRDGQQFERGQATLIDYRNSVLKVQNNAGQWWTPSGNGWAATGAP